MSYFISLADLMSENCHIFITLINWTLQLFFAYNIGHSHIRFMYVSAEYIRSIHPHTLFKTFEQSWLKGLSIEYIYACFD